MTFAATDRTTQDQLNAYAFLEAFAADRSRSARACLQGYAGTGKTWLVGTWLEQLTTASSRTRVCIAAPTHKALQVLREKCGNLPVTFKTVDSLLGFRISRNDDGEIVRGSSSVEYPYDIIAVDEASMLKAEYVQRLNALPCKVLYIGDPAQLPPINEQLSDAFKTPRRALMTQVVRQQQDNPVTAIATRLRACQEERAAGGGLFTLMDARQLATDKRVTFTSVERMYDWAEKATVQGMDNRILCYTNRAVNAHNAVMHERLYPGTPLFGVGEVVLVNEAFPVPKQPDAEGDDEDDELMTNGTTLVVKACTQAAPVAGVDIYDVTVDWGGRELVVQVAQNEAHMLSVRKGLTDQIWKLRREGLGAATSAKAKELVALRKPLNQLAPLRHSYACTVHKSQGSTYKAAFVDWSDVYVSDDRLKLLYVACTRPSEFLVLVK